MTNKGPLQSVNLLMGRTAAVSQRRGPEAHPGHLVDDVDLEYAGVMERPFLYLERELEEDVSPADHCCCRCCGISLPAGLKLCIHILILESVLHLMVSLLRERWTWTSTALTIVVFMLQTAVRVVTVPVALYAHSHLLGRRDQGLQTFFRFLVCLVLLEVVEMVLRFWEVEAMCSVAQQHGAGGVTVAGAVLLSNTSSSTAYTSQQCEYLADTLATVGGIATLLFFMYTAWMVHSVRVRLTNGTLDGAVVGSSGRASSSASTSPVASPRAGAPAPPTLPDPYGHGTQV